MRERDHSGPRAATEHPSSDASSDVPARAPMSQAGRFAAWLDAPVQRKMQPSEGAGEPGEAARSAASGLHGAPGSLPHLDAVQGSFGRHDVRGIEAHVGGAAEGAARSLGAAAYATGRSVAFAAPPDLHTAAHEAAHVVQQRDGVQLKGGVSEPGDAYEQHADQVAQAVVDGRSAEGLLDTGPRGGAPAPVQRIMEPGEKKGTWRFTGKNSKDDKVEYERSPTDERFFREVLNRDRVFLYDGTNDQLVPLPPEKWPVGKKEEVSRGTRYGGLIAELKRDIKDLKDVIRPLRLEAKREPTKPNPKLLERRKQLLALRKGAYAKMLDPEFLAEAAADPELFGLLYKRVRPPEREKVPVLEGKERQELFSLRDQLLYMIQRSEQIFLSKGATSETLRAKEKAEPEIAGLKPEEKMEVMQRIRARAQRKLEKLGKEDVRLPSYYHRTKAMTGIEGIWEKGVEVTNTSVAGEGAYVSTNLDGVYGPYGYAFDMRDLHQQDLSKSTDNTKKFTGETVGSGSFRAMSTTIKARGSVDKTPPQPSSRNEDTDKEQKGKGPELELRNFFAYLIENTNSTVSQEDHAKGTDPKKKLRLGEDDVVDVQEAQYERIFLEELLGRFEPRHWYKKWKTSEQFISNVSEVLKGMLARSTIDESKNKGGGGGDEVDSDEWNDD